jgi:hypothetical protein
MYVWILLLVHTYNYNICADFVVCYGMQTTGLLLLSLECTCRAIWSLRVSRRSIAHRQEFEFQLPFALRGKWFSPYGPDRR